MDKLYDKIYEAVNTGIQKALILDPDKDTSIKFHNKEISTEFIPYEYRTVDMGKAGIWCEYNLGSFPSNNYKDWYGDYYAWGETEVKDNYSGETYQYYGGTKDMIAKYNKNDKLIRLEPNDDVVMQTLGNKFRMPTKEEYDKLINNTINKWVENYNGIHGLNGRLFIAENGNTLFFPVAGFYDGSERYSAGQYGYIWTASLGFDDPYGAFILGFYSNGIVIGNDLRCDGLPVRGIQNSYSN